MLRAHATTVRRSTRDTGILRKPDAAALREASENAADTD
jgi:hypothetical protein